MPEREPGQASGACQSQPKSLVLPDLRWKATALLLLLRIRLCRQKWGNWLNTDVIIKKCELIIGVYLADKDQLLTYKWFVIAGNTKARNTVAFPHNGGAMLVANNI